MLKQTLVAPEPLETFAPFSPAIPVLSPHVITDEGMRIALFLDGIMARLAPLPAEVHGDVCCELRGHLDSLVVAHEELGATREQAVDAAIQQFSDSRQIARRATEVRERPWAAMRLALGTFSAAIALAILCDLAMSGYNIWRFGDHHPSSNEGNLIFGFVLALPVPVGIYVGRRSPRRAALGAFLALLPLMVAAFLLDSLFFSWNYGYGGSPFTIVGFFHTLTSDIPMMAYYMLPIGWLAATMTSALQLHPWRQRVQ